jgi:hypothetical protein
MILKVLMISDSEHFFYIGSFVISSLEKCLSYELIL